METKEIMKQIADWARQFGGRLVTGTPLVADDMERFTAKTGIKSSQFPEGSMEFWRNYGNARIEVRSECDRPDEWTILPAIFRIYSPLEALDAVKYLKIPTGVKIENRLISTAHLLPIALTDRLVESSQWCISFNPREVKPVIIYNDMEELPWARYEDTGEYILDQGFELPGNRFETFCEWLQHYVEHVCSINPQDLYRRDNSIT